MQDRETELQELGGKNMLSEIFLTAADEEFPSKALRLVTEVCACQFGLLGIFTENKSFVVSAMTGGNLANEPPTPYQDNSPVQDIFPQLRQKLLEEKKPFYTKKKTINFPQSQIPVKNGMITPVIFRTEIISAIYLADKAGGFNDRDRFLMESIADRLAPILAIRREKEIEKYKRRQAEEALRQSEYQYRHIVDNISSGVAVYEVVDDGRDFVFKNLNHAAIKHSKLIREEVIGKSVMQIFPNLTGIGLLDVFKRVWETGLPEHHPTSHYQDDRISQWVQNYVFRLPSGEIVAVFDDISEQIRIREEAIRSEGNFRRLLESTCTVPWELDPVNGNFIFMGKQIETLLGYPAESWVNVRIWLDRLYEKDRDCVVPFCANEPGNGNDLDFTCRAVHADGTVKWIHNIVSMMQNSNGTKNLIGFMRDITKRKNDEEEMIRLEQRLRHAQKMESIGALAGGIAHDFNNILASIIGYADLMAEDALPGTQLAADLQQIINAGLKAKKLVQQIFAFSRQAKVERIPVRLQPLVLETLKLLHSTIPTTIEIQQEITQDPSNVWADPAQIHQILINLCTNAYHAMEKTGGILRVELKTKKLDHEDFPEFPNLKTGFFAELVVSDTGPGITAEIREKIFNPYFTTKEQGKGTGLGLAIVHGTAVEYGGMVTVDSSPGKGSAFHVFLPLTEENPIQDDAIITGPAHGGTERILLVDDEESLLHLGEKILTKLGYSVVTQKESLAALLTFKENPYQFDLIITDQTMPHMNGADLAVKMMEIRPDIPVILCTGYTSLITDGEAKAIGIREVVMKPLAPAEMARVVRQILNGGGGGRQG